MFASSKFSQRWPHLPSKCEPYVLVNLALRSTSCPLLRETCQPCCIVSCFTEISKFKYLRQYLKNNYNLLSSVENWVSLGISWLICYFFSPLLKTSLFKWKQQWSGCRNLCGRNPLCLFSFFTLITTRELLLNLALQVDRNISF